jgi:hypothetical protein
MGDWLRREWLEAQGVLWPDHRRWKAKTFEAYPPHCVICGREWRPDKPYNSLYGKTRLGSNGPEWFAPRTGIVSTTGLAPGQVQVRYICPEHGELFGNSLVDCTTGESIEMRPSPTRLQRVWRDALYWTGSALRFLFLLAQWAWLWMAYKVAGYAPLTVRAPWPPLRKAT